MIITNMMRVQSSFEMQQQRAYDTIASHMVTKLVRKNFKEWQFVHCWLRIRGPIRPGDPASEAFHANVNDVFIRMGFETPEGQEEYNDNMSCDDMSDDGLFSNQ